jgi:hypothetical protein
MFSAMNKEKIESLQDCLERKKLKTKERNPSDPGAWRRKSGARRQVSVFALKFWGCDQSLVQKSQILAHGASS